MYSLLIVEDVYLVAFNLMAFVYPIAGCLREYTRFGLADAGKIFTIWKRQQGILFY